MNNLPQVVTDCNRLKEAKQRVAFVSEWVQYAEALHIFCFLCATTAICFINISRCSAHADSLMIILLRLGAPSACSTSGIVIRKKPPIDNAKLVK